MQDINFVGCATQVDSMVAALGDSGKKSNLRSALNIYTDIVSNIAMLRTLPKLTPQGVVVLGYYAPGDGGGGNYWCDVGDTTTADNGGTVIVASDGGRWKLAYTTRLNPKQFGAKEDGTTDDAVPIASSIAGAGQEGALETLGQNCFVSSFFNPLGIKFTGGGTVLIPASQGGNYAATSYADEGQMIIGREYLYRLFSRIKVGGNLTGFIYGDSTAATAAHGGGYAGAANEPQMLLAQLLQNRRVKNNINLTNRAIGGTRVVQMNAIPDIDTVNGATDLFVIKYGINDAQDGVNGFATNLRAKLAEIRANPYGSVSSLSIVLVGPNATFDPQHGRSSTWYEKIRGIYVAAARDYQCMFVDTYAYLRDMSWASTFLQDNPFGNKQGVHPLDIMQRWIWALVAESMIRPGDLIDYSGASSALLLQNGWSAYGNGFALPSAEIDGSGFVCVQGLVKSGTVVSGGAIAQLPSAAYYPQSLHIFEATTSAGRCGIRVNTDGNIEQQDGNASADFTSLSGIRFKPN